MSTRERAQIIFDSLTDEQLDYFVAMFENGFSEPPNTVHSKAELEAMIAEADDDIKHGRVHTAQEVREHLRERYGI